MGTNYVLVDYEGKNALALYKWRGPGRLALYTADHRQVVTAEILETAGVGGEGLAALAPRALHWLEHVVQGRTCYLWSDTAGEDAPWYDYDNEVIPEGWSFYELVPPPLPGVPMYVPQSPDLEVPND